jgi:hypothetical protein
LDTHNIWCKKQGLQNGWRRKSKSILSTVRQKEDEGGGGKWRAYVELNLKLIVAIAQRSAERGGICGMGTSSALIVRWL